MDFPFDPGGRTTSERTTPADLAPLDARVRTVWWITGTITTGVLLVPAIMFDMVRRVLDIPGGHWTATLLVLGGGVLLTALVPLVRYERWRYALREHDLWIRHGLWRVTVSVIPYRRLQFVDTRRGPLERLFGLAQLVVYTAALGTSGRIPGLDAAEAERLRDRLARLQDDDAAV